MIEVGGVRVGLTICEDMWEPGPPASLEAERARELIVNPSGSPYLRGKGVERERMFAERARGYGVPVAFCNLVGGQDELVFDGHSFVVDAERRDRRPGARSSSRTCWSGSSAATAGAASRQPLDDLDEVYARAGARRPRLRRARTASSASIVGLSGGIDSALVALIAADALGPERLTCVVMPSPHSSDETQADARAIAQQPRRRADRAPDRAPRWRAYDAMLGEHWSRRRGSPPRTSRRGSAATC